MKLAKIFLSIKKIIYVLRSLLSKLEYAVFRTISVYICGLVSFLLLVWSLYWKARALWRAARKDDKLWFVALLIINTAGILEILYLYKFSKHEK